jgi:hypothetical protein
MEEANPRREKASPHLFQCGQKGLYSGDPTCTGSQNSMTDSIKARYRESGSDSMAASAILFEIAVSIDEEDREMREDTNQVCINSSIT